MAHGGHMMNGWALLSTLVWAALVGVALWRVEVVFRWFWAYHRQPSESAEPVIVIPDDLDAFALEESEIHAQEAVRDVIRSRYADLKDWNKVRHAIGIGEMP